MNTRTFTLFVLLAALIAAVPVHAVTDAVDNVPAATLLLPYFEVSYTQPTEASHPVFTIGNTANAETLAHVTLWTDRGVPTYSFDVRLAANGVQEIDLFELFANGTLPQTTAGSFASCAATLPPANLDGATVVQLQRAHRGQSSTLLAGDCGGVNYNQSVARGYVTVDVTRSCTSLFPGGAGYFVNGGAGIATNDNVIWGDAHVKDPSRTVVYGTPLVHIEASATDDVTDGVPGHCPPSTTCPPSFANTTADYTFYRLRIGSNADNREALPQQWRGRFDATASASRPFSRTSAQVWRDPGNVAKFPCGSNPPAIPTTEVLPFDDRENPGTGSTPMEFPYATQKVTIAPSGLLPAGFERGFIHYGLNGGSDPVLGMRRQSHVTHIYEGTGIAGAAVGWPMQSITAELPIVYVPGGSGSGAACSDGIDNDSDGLIDFPNDPGCRAPSSFLENPECNDSGDNDGDGQNNFPNDPQCHSASDWYEGGNFVCDDGLDNDGDGKIDWPNDLGCFWISDPTEENPCNDGIDNDSDGLIDFPNDPGCGSAFAQTESPQCNDGISNDADGLIDFPADPGCSSAASNNEAPACNDGVSNDTDGLIDFPADPGCASASSFTEAPQCDDKSDNDSDLKIDFPADPGCTSAFDTLEFETQCNDGLDNDGDGLIDFPNETGCSSSGDTSELSDCSDGEDNDCDGLSDATDPGCASPLDPNESSSPTRACSDGIDNDGDGLADYPADPGCTSAYDDVEFDQNAAAAQVEGIPALSPMAMVLLAALLAMVAAIALRGGIMNG